MAAFVITVGVEKAFSIDYSGGRHHAHGHGDGEHH